MLRLHDSITVHVLFSLLEALGTGQPGTNDYRFPGVGTEWSFMLESEAGSFMLDPRDSRMKISPYGLGKP